MSFTAFAKGERVSPWGKQRLPRDQEPPLLPGHQLDRLVWEEDSSTLQPQCCEFYLLFDFYLLFYFMPSPIGFICLSRQ